MNNSESWYIVKQNDGKCAVLPAEQVAPRQDGAETSEKGLWGPYSSEQEAIARRIGLIRSGKCQPA